MIVSVNAKVIELVKMLDIPDEYRDYIEFGRAVKHKFAHRLSTCLAQKIADGLRPKFRGILPDEAGAKHESRSASASGMKKLDVNYSNARIGLGLGVSIKTLNFRDKGTGRFTKNVKRIDGELRAEAQDYHQRQPYAVLTALVFMPGDAARDSQTKSSLRHAWEVFSRRTGRRSTDGDASRFERMWLCVYESNPQEFGSCRCFDVENEFPSTGFPADSAELSNVLEVIESEFSARNKSR